MLNIRKENGVYGDHNRLFWARINNLDCQITSYRISNLAAKLRDLEKKVLCELAVAEAEDMKEVQAPMRAAARELANRIAENMGDGFTVGYDGINTLFVYEHVRGYAKRRTLKEFKGFKVVYQYVGRVRPAKV